MILNNLSAGDIVRIDFPSVKGPCKFVAVIKSGVKPSSFDINRWYGTDAPRSSYRALGVDRYVFKKPGDDFIVIPDSGRISSLISLW